MDLSKLVYFVARILPKEMRNVKFNKSYDDSVKLKRTEIDPFRLG